MNAGCHMSLSAAAVAMHGKLQGADLDFAGVSTDSRNLAAGQLFFALQGPHFDGHAFVATAQATGAVAAVVSEWKDCALPQIVVADTRQALADLAGAWRARFAVPVIAITGSNGKTTVKEMLAAIFAQKLGSMDAVLATRGNLNNEIGVPLTLLRLDKQHGAAVIEEGASHVGDIAYLTRFVRPAVAVVTNAAGAHLAGFGSLDAVAQTKGEIYQFLAEDGRAIVNADDTYAPLWRELAGEHALTSFGLQQAADVHGVIETAGALHITTPQGEISVQLPLAGRHNAMNALAATAAAQAAGVALDAIKAGLESVQPAPGRLQWKSGIKGACILDDTYNANPVSLQAALEVLAACNGDHYLALGDMAELGDQAQAYHEQAGRQARQSGVQRLYAVGEQSRHAVNAFGADAHHFTEQGLLISQLQEDLHADVTLLVKGSRSAHMERVVDALCAGGGN
jgi:UDP-N-acetylmuramoyl-tripeptide--D-alanyl-D-alanine ligase